MRAARSTLEMPRSAGRNLAHTPEKPSPSELYHPDCHLCLLQPTFVSRFTIVVTMPTVHGSSYVERSVATRLRPRYEMLSGAEPTPLREGQAVAGQA